ncbi:MAG: potassium-transporting ATPase subunit KdpC [Gemmatimonadetes bacterium]|nr:potassium-transporting ATPase subunit KdpC [Gemmatimonadota bacterium]
MKEHIRPALTVLLAMTVLTGIAYPLVVTGLAQTIWPEQAIGSVLTREGRTVGSALIGQPFHGAGYFWSRPSATGPVPYNAAASSGSNLAPSNPALAEAVAARVAALREQDPMNPSPVPEDLVPAAGSGLDPHVSPAAALWQVPRVARARGLDEAAVRELVNRHTEGRQLGILGEPRVNVLELNLALDSIDARGPST